MRRTLLLIPLFVLAGCAGNTQTPSVATAGGATPTASSSAAATGGGQGDAGDQVKFAKCMRENGVPDFPDPDTTDPNRFSIMIPEGTPKATAETAMEACKQFTPNGGERRAADPAVTEQLRKLSKCMRENGFPEFPDPGADGGIQLEKRKDGTGIDPESAEFKKAEETCKQFQPSPPAGGGKGKTTSQDGK